MCILFIIYNNNNNNKIFSYECLYIYIIKKKYLSI